MSSEKLRIEYHPAKGMIRFFREENGRYLPPSEKSTLKQYSNKKDFILQDQGIEFLESIARFMNIKDGKTIIELSFCATKLDCEDLMQMSNNYNKKKDRKCQFIVTHMVELPSMESLYNEVMNVGNETILNLRRCKTALQIITDSYQDIPDSYQDIPDSYNVSDAIGKFMVYADEQSRIVSNRLKAMDTNEVNLCFVGAYSTGKSVLINALLGYAIMPDSVGSKTAKLFIIHHVSDEVGQQVKISLNVKIPYGQDEVMEIVWDHNRLHMQSGPIENELSTDIKTLISKNTAEPRHKQIHEVLQYLNKADTGYGIIHVYFPIFIGDGSIKFSIFDTPGTDSNYTEHGQILEMALKKQTHSILIFVNTPDKIEGEGNSTLLSQLKDIDEQGYKSGIDMGRSLVVINKSDTLNDSSQFTDLQKSSIQLKLKANYSKGSETEENKVLINLADKRLFFTSATSAYSAKAIKNNIADVKENNIFKKNEFEFINNKHWLYNRLAHSDYETEIMKRECEKALVDAGDEMTDIFHVNTGMFALERELVKYGSRYALAVKAKAIIEVMENVLEGVREQAESIKGFGEKSADENKKEYETLHKEITDGIKQIEEKNKLKKSDAIGEEDLKKLHLDMDSVKNKVNEIEVYTKINAPGAAVFIKGKERMKDEDKKVRDYATDKANQFTRYFSEGRTKVLEEKRDKMIKDIEELIKNNKGLSEKAKDAIIRIEKPIISEFSIDELINAFIKNKKTFLFVEYIDKNVYVNEIRNIVESHLQNSNDQYRENYKIEMNNVSSKIRASYTVNILRYSTALQLYESNRKAAEALVEAFDKLSGTMEERQKELNRKIWGEEQNI